MRDKKVNIWNILWISWQLRRKVPIAKIIHKRWFYGLPFYTNRHTLDPRPDSETLVDAVLSDIRDIKSEVRILDLGTGTGCLLCAILKNAPYAAGVGIDKSWRARRIARKNIRALGLSNRAKVKYGTFRQRPESAFDIVISNPPYIPIGDVNVDAGARHDPKIALYGGADGLKYYREISEFYTPAGGAASIGGPRFYIEIGAGQEPSVRRIFEEAGWRFLKKYADLSGHVRVLAFIFRFS